jgi:hypothetical protein
VHQLDAGDRNRRITELLEAKHHSDALLHGLPAQVNTQGSQLRADGGSVLDAD